VAVEGSNIVTDFTCTLGTVQKQTKKRHPVVEITDYESAIVGVVTNLSDVTVEEIIGMLIALCQTNRYCYGHRKMKHLLKKSYGIDLNRNTVQKLMQKHNLQCRVKK